MNVIGIIAEYNPFHNGHAYQIAHVKKNLHADYIVVAASGDYVQRGEPALLDKYTRARMALSSGADLVLELPVLWSTASAELFADAGISLFENGLRKRHLLWRRERRPCPPSPHCGRSRG